MKIIVTTDAGQTVDARQIEHDQSDTAVGREITGRPMSILGWLGRALQDAKAIEQGRDPERPSEKAMRLSERRRNGATS